MICTSIDELCRNIKKIRKGKKVVLAMNYTPFSGDSKKRNFKK